MRPPRRAAPRSALVLLIDLAVYELLSKADGAIAVRTGAGLFHLIVIDRPSPSPRGNGLDNGKFDSPILHFCSLCGLRRDVCPVGDLSGQPLCAASSVQSANATYRRRNRCRMQSPSADRSGKLFGIRRSGRQPARRSRPLGRRYFLLHLSCSAFCQDQSNQG